MPRNKRLLTIDDLFRLNVISSVSLSPDGRECVYASKRANLKKNENYSALYRVSTAGGDPEPLTRGEYRDTKPAYAPDGRWLAFLSNRNKSTGLWILPLNGGEPVCLTPPDLEVVTFTWAPDSRKLACSARELSDREKLHREGQDKELERRPAYRHITRLHYKEDGAGFWEGTWLQIYRVGIGGGTPRRLIRDSRDWEEPVWSPAGDVIACTVNLSADYFRDYMHRDIVLLSPDGKTRRPVTTLPGNKGGLSWSPDGRAIAYCGNTAGPGEFNKKNVHVFVQPVQGGKAKNVTVSLDYNCANLTIADVVSTTFAPEPPLWSADGMRLWFPVSEHGACNLYEKNLRTGTLRRRIGGDQVAFGLSRTAGRGPAALIAGDMLNPGDVHLLEPESEQANLRRLTRVNDDVLQSIDLSEPESVQWRQGRKTIEGWIMKPPRFRADKKYPLILQIHGGPHAQYGYAFFHEMQWLAAQGYVVAFANPTGSIGYGLDFQTELWADWGTPDYKDLMVWIDQLARKRWVDSRRLYVTGGSYGGFMTNMIVSRTRRFRAAVTQRSVVNMTSMWASDWGFEIGWEIGGMHWKDIKQYWRLSPLSFAHKIETPLLIIHSAQDYRCPVGQAEELFTTLKFLEKEVEFVLFEGESHGLSRGGRPQNRAERLRRILDWFERHK